MRQFPNIISIRRKIGIIEVETGETPAKKKRETRIAEAQAAHNAGHPYAILDIIDARNQGEEGTQNQHEQTTASKQTQTA